MLFVPAIYGVVRSADKFSGFFVVFEYFEVIIFFDEFYKLKSIWKCFFVFDVYLCCGYVICY